MSYYYSTHLRNLEEESLTQRKKIEVELYEKQLLAKKNEKTQRSTTPQKRTKFQQDQEVSAFLERSRLSSELSANRSKAEQSMTRSRLETAFELRKENQQAYQQSSRMAKEHESLRIKYIHQEAVAKENYIKSQHDADMRLREEEELFRRILEQKSNKQLRLSLLAEAEYAKIRELDRYFCYY